MVCGMTTDAGFVISLAFGRAGVSRQLAKIAPLTSYQGIAGPLEYRGSAARWPYRLGRFIRANFRMCLGATRPHNE